MIWHPDMNVTIYWVENNQEICERASGNSGKALSSSRRAELVVPVASPWGSRGVPVGLHRADAVGISIAMQRPGSDLSVGCMKAFNG